MTDFGNMGRAEANYGEMSQLERWRDEMDRNGYVDLSAEQKIADEFHKKLLAALASLSADVPSYIEAQTTLLEAWNHDFYDLLNNPGGYDYEEISAFVADMTGEAK